MKTYQILLSITLLTMFGCATANGPAFNRTSRKEEKSTIYIYRLSYGGNQSAYSPTVIVDSKEIMKLPRLGYTVLEVEEGSYTIGFKHNPLAGYKPVYYKLDVEKGKEYFVKITDGYNASGGVMIKMNYTSTIEILPEEVAISELSQTKFVPNNF